MEIEQGGGQDFVINLQPRFYGLSYDNVTQFEASYTEEQLLNRARRLKNQQRRRMQRLLLALIAVTMSVVVMIFIYSIIATSRDYYGGRGSPAVHRRHWWWGFFRRKMSDGDKRAGGELDKLSSNNNHNQDKDKAAEAASNEDPPPPLGDGGGGSGADNDDQHIVGKTWLRNCDNSKQGQTYVVDERGYVCRWDQMYAGSSHGCCWEADRTNISRYSCHQCDTRTSCCMEYEFCVSCCLNPSHQTRVDSWLRMNLEDLGDQGVLSEAGALSRLEQCLALCRTSSASILRQHVFIAPAHFCYAAAAPPAAEGIER